MRGSQQQLHDTSFFKKKTPSKSIKERIMGDDVNGVIGKPGTVTK